MEIDTKGTEIALLPPPERAALVLKSVETERQLTDLVAASADIKAVIDAAGREQAHRAGMQLKNARVAIEKTGKGAREDATAFSKAVIAEEARLQAIISAEEKRLFGLRDSYDAKVEAEKLEKERAAAVERQRIDNAISDIQFTAVHAAGKDSAGIQALIDELELRRMDAEEFGDRLPEAVLAKNSTLTKLREMHADQARLQAEREAAAQLRQEQEAEQERIRKQQADIARQQQELDEQRRDMERQQAARADLEKLEPRVIAVPETDISPAILAGCVEMVTAPTLGEVMDALNKCAGPDGKIPLRVVTTIDDSDPFAGMPTATAATLRNMAPLDEPAHDPVDLLPLTDDELIDGVPTLAELAETIADAWDVDEETATRWIRAAAQEA